MTSWWWSAAGAVLVISVVAEVVFHDASHSLYWWHDVPGFDFVLGLVGCAAIVVVSKTLGSLGIQRPDDRAGEDQT